MNRQRWAVFYKENFVGQEWVEQGIEKKNVIPIARKFAKTYKCVNIARIDSKTGRYQIVASIINHNHERGKIFEEEYERNERNENRE